MKNFIKQFGILSISVFVIFITNACSVDDDTNSESSVLDGGTVYTSQIVTIARENLTQNLYEATFNGNAIQLSNSGNNELEFVVLSSLAIIESNNLLEIPSLNLKITYNVLTTTLPVSAEEALQPFVVNLNNLETSDSPQGNTVRNFIDSFNQYYSSLSEAEKQEMAEFYYANKELFDQTFLFVGRSSENNELIANVTACETAKLSFVGLGAIAALTVTAAPPLSILAAAGAVVAFETAVDNCHNFMTAKIKQAIAKIGNLEAERGMQLNDDEFLQFDNEVTKALSMVNGKRAVQSSDSDNGNSYIMTFFSTVTEINGFIVSTLNDLIGSYNNYAPSYFQLEPFDNVNIPNNSPIDEQPLTEEEYNKFSFSVTSNNVAIQSISYSNGSINLKLKIIDLSQVGDDGISTSLNYTYTDEFNNNQGSFPIKVMPASSIVGNWKIVSSTAGSLDNCRIINNLYTYKSNGTYENELYKLTNGDC